VTQEPTLKHLPSLLQLEIPERDGLSQAPSREQSLQIVAAACTKAPIVFQQGGQGLLGSFGGGHPVDDDV
jgi:hypothetical protein